jgi:hypothetical protein
MMTYLETVATRTLAPRSLDDYRSKTRNWIIPKASVSIDWIDPTCTSRPALWGRARYRTSGLADTGAWPTRVLAFAREATAVVAASRTEAKLRDLAHLGPSLMPVAPDVTDRSAVLKSIADAQPLDILVNCPGLGE